MTSKKVSKKKVHTKKVTSKNKEKDSKQFLSLLLKLIVLGILIYGILFLTSSNSNTISLLAVSEDENGDLKGGSVIDLTLEVKPGTGEVFLNSRSIKETDTQVTLVKAHAISCNIFNLDCENNDFFFTFSGSNSILKGPSASAGIAILTAMTMNREHISSDIAITGSLNSGGVIGNVGGIEEKVEVARERGFNRVVIPTFSQVNISELPEGIEVYESIDIVHTYNLFSIKEFSLEQRSVQSEEYDAQMLELGNSLCERAEEIKSNLELYNINNQTMQFVNRGDEAYQNAMNAINNSNYYSAGSFCFNANNNFQTALFLAKNDSSEILIAQLNNLEFLIQSKQREILSSGFVNNINTINDFYVYLLLNDRVFESEKIIEQFRERTNEFSNLTDEQYYLQLASTLALSQERFNTALLWETLIVGSGKTVEFSNSDLRNACNSILEEISLTNQLLNRQGPENIFASEIDDLNQARITNTYLCIYKGVQLQARMNHVLNSASISPEQIDSYAQTMSNITYSRLSLLEEDSFPLIPFIYYEFSSDLIESDPYSSILYSHNSLAFTDLYLFFQDEEQSLWKQFHNSFFLNPLPYIGLIVVLALL